jgi:acyl carrier protein
MDNDNIAARIRSFLKENVRNRKLDDDEDIFARGYVNSLFAMQLVTFLEAQFQLRIEDEDLEMENFQSVNAITRLIGRKLQAGFA